MMMRFEEKFPVHSEILTNVEDLNRILENDIREDNRGTRQGGAATDSLFGLEVFRSNYCEGEK